MTTVARAPTGLTTRSRRFWRNVLAEYELTSGELALLEQACRTLDTIERLYAKWIDAPVMVAGSKGQPVANSLPKELREERALLTRLLDQIGLIEGASGEWDGLSASERGRKAALKRWDRRGACTSTTQ